MRAVSAAFLVALGLAASAAAQPTAVPTPAGAGAVAPSDQTAVKPALPDERANRNVALGTASAAPAALPQPDGARPAPAPTPSASVEEAGRSEPDTGALPAAAGSVHKKPGVAPGRPVQVGKVAPYTVVAYEAGKNLTLRRPEGTTVTYPLAKKADVPQGLAAGHSVTIRTRSEGGKKVVARVRAAGDTPVLSNVNGP